jgi:hypothetical protein
MPAGLSHASRKAGSLRKFFLILRPVCWPLSRGFYFKIEPDFHLLSQTSEWSLHRRLSLCFPASLETYQREHREFTLSRPVRIGLQSKPCLPHRFQHQA